MNKLPLSKQLTFVAIVGGVAFATSFLLALLTAGSPDNGVRTSPTWFIGLILGVSAGAIYLLLSGNRSMPLADDAARVRALAGATADEAQLLVFREGFVGKLAGVDILVDGDVATQLKSPRFAALTLAPGRHEIVASVQGKRTDPVVLDLAMGESAALRVDVAIGRAKLVRQPDVVAVRSKLATVPMIVGA